MDRNDAPSGGSGSAASQSLAANPPRDADGTVIPLQSRVEQVAVDQACGALTSRLNQHGQVIGHSLNLIHVRFGHEYHLTTLRPHLVRLVPTPDSH
ncbi:MAG: hypothetical protein ACRDRS_09640 [Pseudonocardiaceae bacterium]